MTMRSALRMTGVVKRCSIAAIPIRSAVFMNRRLFAVSALAASIAALPARAGRSQTKAHKGAIHVDEIELQEQGWSYLRP